MLGGALLGLAACGASAPSAERIALRPPESAVTASCAQAAMLPDGALDQAQVERAWIADRMALRDCRARHRLAAAWVARVVADFAE